MLTLSELCSPAFVRELMARHGIAPRREFGQNFLINPAIPRRIAEAAVGGEADVNVLEIGPGIGTMTTELSRLAGKVAAVEIDRALIPVLAETLDGCENVAVINRDIMKCSLPELTREAFGDEDYRVCANLPYYITSPIIMKLLEEGGERLRSVTVMIQTEVASRLTASPGTQDYGSITAAVAYYGTAKKLFTVSPGSFLPAPKVTSTVIKIELYRPGERPVTAKDEKTLFRVISSAFGQRRKTLPNALSAGMPELSKDAAVSLVTSLGYDERIRGEALGIGDFARIADAITAETAEK